MKLKTYNLLCRFCQKHCGEYQYPDDVSIESLGIADIRCSDCEILYGSFSKMSQEYMTLGKTYDEFLTIIKKADYKKDKFDKEVEKIKTAMLKPVLGGIKKKKLKK